MSRYSAAVFSLAAMAAMASACAAPADREKRLYQEDTRRIRRCFERMLGGISKAHDYGFPNISRQQRRQLARKGLTALSADTGSREG